MCITLDRMVKLCEQVQIGRRPWSVILELFRVALKKKCPECPRAYINEIRNISLLGAHIALKEDNL